MEVYRFRRQKNRKAVSIIFGVYAGLVVLYFLNYHFVAQILVLNPKYEKNFFVEHTKGMRQKVLILKRIFIQKNLEIGDIVYVKNTYPSYKKNFTYRLRQVIFFMSLGVLRQPYDVMSIRMIVAKAGDTVEYNAQRILAINGEEIAISSRDDNIPALGFVRTKTLEENELFLVGAEQFSIDDRLGSVSTIHDVKGKIIFLLGHQWGFLAQ